MLTPRPARFALILSAPVRDGRDGIIGTTSRVLATTFTEGWMEVVANRLAEPLLGALEDGELHLSVKELVDGRWVPHFRPAPVVERDLDECPF